MKAPLPFALPALALFTLTPADAQEPATLMPATVVEVITENDDLSTLASALEAAGLAEALSGGGPFTVFAPTNEAFEALPEGELERLLASPDELAQVLSYHVVSERLLEENFGEFVDDSAAPLRPETLAGETLSIDVEEDTDPGVVINNVAGLEEADVTAGNGVVHLIDAVLLPGVSADGAPDTMSGSGASGGGY